MGPALSVTTHPGRRYQARPPARTRPSPVGS